MIFIIIGIKNFIFFESKCFDVKNDQVFFIMESVWEENKQFYRNFIFVIFARSFVRNFTLRIQNTELCFCCSCIGNLTGFFKQLILPMMNFFFFCFVCVLLSLDISHCVKQLATVTENKYRFHHRMLLTLFIFFSTYANKLIIP